jgi:hypothetical protein
VAQAAGNSGRLLDERGILLRHRIQAADRCIDVADDVGLLPGAGADLLDDLRDTLSAAESRA